jgi:UDP-N-acetylmuramoyl-L-alanyl-D-glutamate--2,6-diaminopimelate ligase
VAGKGHETYQDIQGVKHDFDDKQVISEAFAKV